MTDSTEPTKQQDSPSGLNDGLGGEITPEQAIKALSKAMKDDCDYAWSWHCNIAMVAQDAGAPHKESNERAASFMRYLFGVDTNKPPNAELSGAAKRPLE